MIPRPTLVKGLRWVMWLNPLRYAFESIITNEFRSLNGTCSNVVPRGPGYEGVDIANTVCAVVGAQPGRPTVDGATFMRLAYAFYFSNTWRVRDFPSQL